MDTRKMGSTNQPSLHGIFRTADRLHGVSSVPTRARGEHELRKHDIRRGYNCEHGPMVRLWEDILPGTGEGGH